MQQLLMSNTGLDPFSYTSQARLKVLLAPLRPIKRAQFDKWVHSIRLITDVRLEDVKVNATKEHSETSLLRV